MGKPKARKADTDNRHRVVTRSQSVASNMVDSPTTPSPIPDSLPFDPLTSIKLEPPAGDNESDLMTTSDLRNAIEEAKLQLELRRELQRLHSELHEIKSPAYFTPGIPSTAPVFTPSVKPDTDASLPRWELKARKQQLDNLYSSLPTFTGQEKSISLSLRSFLERQAEFFDSYHAFYNTITDDIKLSYARSKLSGRADRWYSRAYSSSPFASYDDFVSRIKAQFLGTHSLVDVVRQIRPLTQTGTLASYIDRFDDLVYQAQDAIAEPFKIALFLTGLQDDLFNFVTSSGAPTTLTEAYHKARDYKLMANPRGFYDHHSKALLTPPVPESTPSSDPPSDVPPSGHLQQRKTPICYNCDEPGHTYHRCPLPLKAALAAFATQRDSTSSHGSSGSTGASVPTPPHPTYEKSLYADVYPPRHKVGFSGLSASPTLAVSDSTLYLGNSHGDTSPHGSITISTSSHGDTSPHDTILVSTSSHGDTSPHDTISVLDTCHGDTSPHGPVLDSSRGDTSPHDTIFDIDSSHGDTSPHECSGLIGYYSAHYAPHRMVKSFFAGVRTPLIDSTSAQPSTVDVYDNIYIDSGASYHMTGDLSLLTSVRSCPVISIDLANGAIVQSSLMGTFSIPHSVCFPDVLYVPGLAYTLISVRQIHESTYSINFCRDGRVILEDASSSFLLGYRTCDGFRLSRHPHFIEPAASNTVLPTQNLYSSAVFPAVKYGDFIDSSTALTDIACDSFNPRTHVNDSVDSVGCNRIIAVLPPSEGETYIESSISDDEDDFDLIDVAFLHSDDDSMNQNIVSRVGYEQLKDAIQQVNLRIPKMPYQDGLWIPFDKYDAFTKSHMLISLLGYCILRKICEFKTKFHHLDKEFHQFIDIDENGNIQIEGDKLYEDNNLTVSSGGRIL